MEESPHIPFERPLVVGSEPVCLPEFGHPNCSSTLDLTLHRSKESDVGRSAGSEFGHLDVIESVVSYDGASRVPEQTGVESFDDDDGGLSRDPMLGFDKLSQDLYNVHPHKKSYDGLANIASNILLNRQAFTDGEVVDVTFDITEAGSDKDQLAIKLEQSLGPGRHYHPLGTSEETVGAGAAEASDTQPKVASILEKFAPGFSTASSSLSSVSRQTRINESEGVIHRLMPSDRTIHFDVDTDSFSRAGISPNIIYHITHAAREVAREFRARNLGIAFAFTPGPGPKVFSIRYDPALADRTLAEAFFPCDPHERWQVRVSPIATVPWYFGGRLDSIRNILAHEFTHILGFRHWNAGFDAAEMRESSMLWPGTVDGNRHTIMNTGVHSSELCFSREDFRVISELYSAANGVVVRDGRVIMDVVPYDARNVL